MRTQQFALVNANILTMDAHESVVSALAVDGERIIARGDRDEVMMALPAGAPAYDMGGRTVLPGFIDVHTHVEFIALSRHFWHDVRGLSREAILHQIQSKCEQAEPGQWLVFQGTFGQDLPSLEELDSVAPANPVAVRWTMHKFVLNSSALSASAITSQTVAPVGVRLQKDNSGRLNGVIEEGWDLVAAPDPAPGEFAEAVEETLRSLFLNNGVTTVHEIGRSTAGIRALRKLSSQGTIPRIGLLLTAAPGHQPLASATDVAFHGLGPGFGDDRLWLQGIKIFMDGGRDGAYRSDLVEQEAEQWGLLTRLYPTLVEELVRASQAGIQVCTHAIGDLAQEIAVSAIERVHEIHPDLDHRMRIEHFFNESTDTAQLERLVNAGGIAVPNPGFVFAEPDDPDRRQPPGANKYALKTLRAVQGIVPGNSDTAGAQPFTTNPWFTMKCMLELKNRNGIPINEAERLDVMGALRGFTTDAAFATRQEHDKGSLEVGKLADIIIIDEDPFTVPAEAFDTILTRVTMIGGQPVNGTMDAFSQAS